MNKNHSIREAASYVAEKVNEGNNHGIQEWGIEPAQNFIVAHSEGGIVSRDLERITQNMPQNHKIGGLVTFGTSHGGAQIMNNRGDIDILAIDACDNLLDPLLLTFVDQGIKDELPLPDFVSDPLKILVVNQGLLTIGDKVRNDICENILPLALHYLFADQLKPIGNDYAMGARVITELSHFQTNIPKVLAYGTEDNNQIWRAIESMVIHPPTTFPLFEATDDDVTNNINQLQIDMTSAADALVNNWTIDQARRYVDAWWIFDPILKRFLRDLIEKAENQTNTIRRVNDFLGTMNDRWLTIIGSRVRQVNSTTEINCYCWKKVKGGEIIETEEVVENENDCIGQDGWHCRARHKTTTEVTFQFKPSDCIVTNESSFQFPGMNNLIKMDGSNHMQMRNDQNLKRTLSNLYDGILLQYFKTATRH